MHHATLGRTWLCQPTRGRPEGLDVADTRGFLIEERKYQKALVLQPVCHSLGACRLTKEQLNEIAPRVNYHYYLHRLHLYDEVRLLFSAARIRRR